MIHQHYKGVSSAQNGEENAGSYKGHQRTVRNRPFPDPVPVHGVSDKEEQ